MVMVMLKSILKNTLDILLGIVVFPIFVIIILVLGGRWGYEDEIE